MRSFTPEPVIRTNLHGTFALPEAARRHKLRRFLHVSTDEVYGSLPVPIEATEGSPLNPSSPYSASKVGSDLLALSHFLCLAFRSSSRARQTTTALISLRKD